MKPFFLSLLFFLFTNLIFGQNLLLNGKITADQNDLSNILIWNKNQKYEKVTSSGGYFSIKVQLNDTLIFRSDNLYDLDHVVSQADFATDLLQLKMTKMSNILQEVTVYKALDPVAFGILSAPAKQYTVSERRLKSSSSGPVDLLVNSLNGKRKMFKTLIKLENQDNFENKFISLYGRYNLEKDFKIPTDFIESFAQYACSYGTIKDAVNRKEKSKLSFLLIDISNNYKKEFNLK